MADDDFDPTIFDNPFAIKKAEPKKEQDSGYGLDPEFFEATKESFSDAQDLLRAAKDASGSWLGRKFIAPALVKAAKDLAEGTTHVVQQAGIVGDCIREAGDRHAESIAYRETQREIAVKARINTRIAMATYQEKEEAIRRAWMNESDRLISEGATRKLEFGQKQLELKQRLLPEAVPDAVQDAIGGIFTTTEACLAGAAYFGEKLLNASDAKALKAAIAASKRQVAPEDVEGYRRIAINNRQAFIKRGEA